MLHAGGVQICIAVFVRSAAPNKVIIAQHVRSWRLHPVCMLQARGSLHTPRALEHKPASSRDTGAKRRRKMLRCRGSMGPRRISAPGVGLGANFLRHTLGALRGRARSELACSVHGVPKVATSTNTCAF